MALYFSIDFFIDGGDSNSLTDILGLLVFMSFVVGIGTYIIWLTHSQYRVREYHSTKTKKDKLRLIEEYLDQMSRYSKQENVEINITHYSYSKKPIYESINLVLYINDSKLMFNAYYSRWYILDFGRRRRATKNLNAYLKEHL